MQEIAKAIETEIGQRRTLQERAVNRIPWGSLYRVVKGAINNRLKIANIGGHVSAITLANRYAKTKTTGDPILDTVINKAVNKFSSAKTYRTNYMGKTVYLKRYRKPSLAKRVNRLAREVRQRELKTYDENPVSGTVTTTSSIVCVSDMAQGATSITRNGLQIKPVHMEYKIRMVQNSSATVQNQLRIIIFIDKDQAGVIPTAAQLLESDDVNAFPEHDTRPRFKILRDMILTTEAQGGNDTRFRSGIIKFKRGYKIWYHGTSAAEASQGANAVYCYAVANEATNGPTVLVKTRLRFTDP